MEKVYQVITDRILERLESGIVPWQRPWNAKTDWPKNLVSKREYRGINVFMLHSQGYASPFWLSFNQTKDLKGFVQKGSKGSPVIFWKKSEYTKENKDTGEQELRTGFLLRYYTVFNVEQTEGIDPDKIPQVNEQPELNFTPIEICEQVIESMPKRPEITNSSTKAYYSPRSDKVSMPKKESFIGEAEYYSTLFHELTHSTGHESRLNRSTVTEGHFFGSTEYSKEELIAEMGAAFLCGYCGIENKTIDNSASYIQSWLKKLRNDKRMVVIAAQQSQKAADMILNL